ncbi:hypothetical protein HZ326_25095 [Fusarium oxysporum f. sp. albedinis]|nr:hypothetical protein HZ326_25095 [Fusarium oxysporum f. sp. albedinis]
MALLASTESTPLRRSMHIITLGEAKVLGRLGYPLALSALGKLFLAVQCCASLTCLRRILINHVMTKMIAPSSITCAEKADIKSFVPHLVDPKQISVEPEARLIHSGSSTMCYQLPKVRTSRLYCPKPFEDQDYFGSPELSSGTHHLGP